MRLLEFEELRGHSIIEHVRYVHKFGGSHLISPSTYYGLRQTYDLDIKVALLALGFGLMYALETATASAPKQPRKVRSRTSKAEAASASEKK